MEIDIDDLVYSLVPSLFPALDPDEVIQSIEERKGWTGLDSWSESEQEIWQAYLRLKTDIKNGDFSNLWKAREG